MLSLRSLLGAHRGSNCKLVQKCSRATLFNVQQIVGDRLRAETRDQLFAFSTHSQSAKPLFSVLARWLGKNTRVGAVAAQPTVHSQTTSLLKKHSQQACSLWYRYLSGRWQLAAARRPSKGGGIWSNQRGYLTSSSMGYDGQKVLYGLMAANVAVFGLWQLPSLQPFMQSHFLFSVDSLLSLRLHTALTASFSHKDLQHLAVNMMALYVFGSSVMQRYGGQFLLRLYLAGSVGAALAYFLHWTVIVPWLENIPRDKFPARRTPPCQGASGSVNAIIMCGILVNPTQIILLNFFIPVPAALLGLGLIYMDLAGVFNKDYGARIGYSAHLGGAAVGAGAWALRQLRRCR